MSSHGEKKERKQQSTDKKITKKKTGTYRRPVYLLICTFHEPTGGVGLWMALLLVRTYVRRVVAEAASLVFAFIFSRVSICRDMAPEQGLPVARATRTDPILVLDGLALTGEGHEKDVTWRRWSQDSGCGMRGFSCPSPSLLFFLFPSSFVNFWRKTQLALARRATRMTRDSDDTFLAQGQVCFWHSAFDLLE